MISIKNLDKAEVLKALYDGSHIQGLGFLQAVPEGTVTVDHCRELLEQYSYFDYLYGRILKVDLSGDSFEECLYDRDNGHGAAARALSCLENREKNSQKLMTLDEFIQVKKDSGHYCQVCDNDADYEVELVDCHPEVKVHVCKRCLETIFNKALSLDKSKEGDQSGIS